MSARPKEGHPLLLVDKVMKALKKLRKRIKRKFKKEYPYVTISLNRVKNELDVKRRDGIDFLIQKLKEDYLVAKNGTWLIVEEKP